MRTFRQSDIQVIETEIIYEPQRARTPLKFGGAVVESVPFCRIRVTVQNGMHEIAEGWGGIFVMDQWGWPDPEVSREAKQRVMERTIDGFVHLVSTHPAPYHPIELFIDLEDDLARVGELEDKDDRKQFWDRWDKLCREQTFLEVIFKYHLASRFAEAKAEESDPKLKKKIEKVEKKVKSYAPKK